MITFKFWTLCKSLKFVLNNKYLKLFHYIIITGNSWGECDDGSSGIGCGPQEEFRGCADIVILP